MKGFLDVEYASYEGLCITAEAQLSWSSSYGLKLEACWSHKPQDGSMNYLPGPRG